MGFSEKLRTQMELTSQLKPVFTKSVVKKKSDYFDDEEECFSTSTTTYSESRIPTRLPCPSAPKKPKPASSSGGDRDFFHLPNQLEAIFIRRLN
ncbi:hypothetical protein CASFOL_023972 [Castilleja foliolosa]|uniref:Uncharacterized protein n=1 Tax=Castilleja foliolosa TaxID=1961234 RepID=A0ABD3CM04_9LAMI